MKITLTGSLGNISKPLAETLVAAGHEVTVITSNEDKVAAIEAFGAKAAVGSVEDVDFLTGAFSGKDAVYTMVPPNFGAADIRKFIASVGEKYAQAIQASGVKQVLNLSSIGAHLDGGTGPIAGLYDVEQTYAKLEAVAIKHLRPAYFYVNFYGSIGMIKHAGILGSNYDAETPLVLVHPNDIAAAAAEELQHGFTGHSIRYVVSDESTAVEVASVLGAAIGKPELPWVEFNDEDTLQGMIQAGLPEVMAKSYVEMGDATRSRKLFGHYFDNRPATLGKIKLEDFAKEFAQAF
ncbi:NAD(P)H-binding protein [Pedobacter psychroterrae]|uniref:NAD-dependent dehydratase n=1 Tax=Pedobacter psychroterrae TaxID=2530453 RepID=A0A4R0NVB6_9SPHI|nr:NAD(P)H-binding protein [Pedobacter psychroterrae]TCD03485.1 NAD-dependent dehydratase [Pedobacter psychroterrae]